MIELLQSSRRTFVSSQPRIIVNVALLGCGTVGLEVAKLLLHEADAIGNRTGLDIRLKRILVQNLQRNRGVDRRLFTDRFEDLLHADIDLAIEVMGGVQHAAEYVRRLLDDGISVVSANKSLIAHHGDELCRLAATRGASLSYEASVCAAIPVLSSLQRLRGDRVRSIVGILNGSCNYILTRMSEDALSFEKSLDEARTRGLVEPDPSADITGRDSAEKLCVLSSIAQFGRLSLSDVATRGIANITQQDIQSAYQQGCAIKLIAQLHRRGTVVIASVEPALLPFDHPLARVRLEDNALIIDTELGGELFFQGKGAGPGPTASAILSDVLHTAFIRSR